MSLSNVGKYLIAAGLFILGLVFGNISNLQCTIVANLDKWFVMIGRTGFPLAAFVFLLFITSIPPFSLLIKSKDIIGWFKTKAWALQLTNQLIGGLCMACFTVALSKCPQIKLSVLVCSSFIGGILSTIFAMIFLNDVSKISITQLCFSLSTFVIFMPNVIHDGYGEFYLYYFGAALMGGMGDTLSSYLNSGDMDRPSTLIYKKIYPIEQKENVTTSLVYGICTGIVAFIIPLGVVCVRLMFESTRASAITNFRLTYSYWARFTVLFMFGTLAMACSILAFNYASSPSIQPFKIFDIFIATLLSMIWNKIMFKRQFDFEHFFDMFPKYLFVCAGFILTSSIIIFLIKSDVITKGSTLGHVIPTSIIVIVGLGFITGCISFKPFQHVHKAVKEKIDQIHADVNGDDNNKINQAKADKLIPGAL